MAAVVMDGDMETRERLGAALPFSGYHDVRFAARSHEAIDMLDDSVGVVLCDPCLPNACEVFDAALQLQSGPRLVALSSPQCPSELAFGLPQRGVRALLTKPVSAESISHALSAADPAEELERVARARVGIIGAKEAQALVRKTMFQEALRRCRGNRHAAARMLRVDRRVVQIMFNTLEKEGDLLLG